MREDLLNSILSELNGSTADIEASAVLSTDGLMMASMLPAGMDEDRVGAMSAAMLSLGDRTSRELARGESLVGRLEDAARLTAPLRTMMGRLLNARPTSGRDRRSFAGIGANHRKIAFSVCKYFKIIQKSEV